MQISNYKHLDKDGDRQTGLRCKKKVVIRSWITGFFFLYSCCISKLNINNPSQMQRFLDEENNMLKSMVDKISSAGANVVLCQKGIDDMAQHYLAKEE